MRRLQKGVILFIFVSLALVYVRSWKSLSDADRFVIGLVPVALICLTVLVLLAQLGHGILSFSSYPEEIEILKQEVRSAVQDLQARSLIHSSHVSEMKMRSHDASHCNPEVLR